MAEKGVRDVRDTELQTSPSEALTSSYTALPEGSLSRNEMERRSLVASETRFRRLFEAARDGILLVEANTGEITDVNPFLAEILGCSRQEFLHRKL
jgi:PAS domain-containing protein